MRKNNKIGKKIEAETRQGKTIMLLASIFIGVFLMGLIGADYCYQEFANQSTICGGLSGGYYNGTNPSARQVASDGNWNTMTEEQQDYYAIYEKPVDVVGATWKVGVKFSTDYNVLPSSCLQQSFVTVFIHNILNPCCSPDTYSFSCLNNDSTWYTYYSGWASGTIGIKEEAMIWEINHTTTAFVENNFTFNPSTIGGMNEYFALNITYDNFGYNLVSADLIYAGVSYEGGIIGTKENVKLFKTISIPYTSSFTTNNFHWRIGLKNLSGTTVYFNSTAKSQDVFNVQFDDCSTYTNMIYNITLYEQEGKTKLENSSDLNTTIETTTTISSAGTTNIVYNQSVLWFNTNPVQLCMNTTLSNYTYRLDSIIGYKATGYIQQYYYIQNGNLSVNYNPTISLYLLPIAQSTSFLVSYQDENYIYVPNVIIQAWRKYIGTGEFILVEEGKTDANGQTILHLFTEDVVYKFLVWKDGVLQYESPEYLALCQATPCQINLKKPYGVQAGLSPFENIYFNLEFNSTTREISFTFATIDGTATMINMTTINFADGSPVCSDLKVSSGGTIVCQVPITYKNTTYLTEIYKDGKYLGYQLFSLAQTPQQVFGMTGIILSAFAFLTLALMGISSGIATIILGVIGLVFVGLLAIFNTGNIFGIGSALIWIIVASGIIIWKISKRRAS